MNVKTNQRLSPKDFVAFFLPYAKETEKKTGISAIAILTQSAVESGWNAHSPGWMMFGVKDTDGINGNEQLVVTTEYSLRGNCQPKDLGLATIMSVEPVTQRGIKRFKYTGQAYFRKFNSPEESFTDHTRFFFEGNRYFKALTVKNDPDKFLSEIAKAGYATDPSYEGLLLSVCKTIKANTP